jgi:hypothetical protein
MKNFKDRIVHGIMLSTVSLGKWTILHTKNDIILIPLCLLFSNDVVSCKKKKLFSYFTIKIDIYTEDNNLISRQKNTFCNMNYSFLIHVFIYV